MPRLDDDRRRRAADHRRPAAEPAAPAAAAAPSTPRCRYAFERCAAERAAAASAGADQRRARPRPATWPSLDEIARRRRRPHGRACCSRSQRPEGHFRCPAASGLLGRPAATLKAVDGVSFDLQAGETLGIVGESGCGKSTLGRAVLRLIPPTRGPGGLAGRGSRQARQPRRCAAMRRDMQIIFQDPLASLDPAHDGRRDHRRAAATPSSRSLRRAERRGRVQAMMAKVGLLPQHDQPLPARILRRPVPAHRHRPRDDPASRS